MVKYEPVQNEAVKEQLVHKAEMMRKRQSHLLNVNFGMIAALGGVIIMPLVLSIWLGRYLDETYPQRFSWLLSMLFLGFAWGIFNAYLWLKYENEKIERLSEAEQRLSEAQKKEIK
ncbi:MAG: AtpZ/AtpI family protein [Alphaproteobacteria bacterium]|nr:AtpZ/AtpI family protein [Alphaproteobacteria bacterium]